MQGRGLVKLPLSFENTIRNLALRFLCLLLKCDLLPDIKIESCYIRIETDPCKY